MSKTDSSLTFAKTRRLLNKKQFNRVFGNARKVVCSKLVLLVAENDLGFARLGLAISKKNAKRAVSRNLIKRVIRESFRHHQHKIGSVDVVVLSRRSITDLNAKQLRELIDRQWSRLSR